MAQDFLGQAIKYPLLLSGGSIQYQSGSELIKQSISVILNTPKGTEFMLPEYGSRIRELIFEPNDDVLQDLLEHFIYEAMSDWEKRAEFIGVDFDVSTEMVECTIKYKILKSNRIDSFVYPFYRELKY